MNIAEEYLNGLKKRISEYGSEDDLHMLSIAEGASKEEINKLKRFYPECPSELIDLLKCINGTYHRKQGNHSICVYMLGSDLGDYPYFLLSIEQMLKRYNNDLDFSYLMDCLPNENPLD